MILKLMSTLLSGLLVATLGAILVKVVACKLAIARFKKCTRGLPILPGAQLLGNHAFEVPFGEKNTPKLLKYHQELGKTIGWLKGSEFCVSTVDLDFIKVFIQDEPTQHLARTRFNLPLREVEFNIVFDGEEGQEMRRIIAPALTRAFEGELFAAKDTTYLELRLAFIGEPEIKRKDSIRAILIRYDRIFQAHFRVILKHPIWELSLQVSNHRIQSPPRPNKFKTPNVQLEIEESIDKLIGFIEKRLDRDGPEQLFEADDFCARYSLNLILKCFYKLDDVINFEKSRDRYVHMIESAMTMARTSFFVRLSVTFPILRGLIDWLGERLTKIGTTRRIVLEFIKIQARNALKARKHLSELKKEAKEKGFKINPNDFQLKDGTRFRRNMIDHIMDQYLDGKMSTTQFMHNVVFFLLAGFRTAADCLVHTIYLLSVDQEAQDRLRSSIEKDGLESEYLDWVLKESLRLLPPAPTGCSRKILHAIELSSGHVVPKGTYVVTNSFVIHRLREYWGEDADEFKPERWRDTSHHHPMQYLPFGAGLKSCPGKQFAMHEMKMLFVALLTRYKFIGKVRDDVYEFSTPVFAYILASSVVKVRIERL